jgi:gliding motility-associated-like protein
LPISPINAGNDTMIYSIEKIYHLKAINPALTGDGETGTWSILGNGTSTLDDTAKFNTTVRNLAVGTNSFLWTVHRGKCSLKDSVNVELLKDFIPQGFSPNDDAWNNTFNIEGLNLTDQTVELKVVNGAGTEVFSTSNRSGQKWINWDGKNSRGLDLPQGTYYYMLKISSTSGKSFKRSGFIILKRY